MADVLEDSPPSHLGADLQDPSCSPLAGPRTNVWSSTFDPGRNANLRKTGSSYYDKPAAGKEKSVWEMRVDSERSQASAPAAAPATSAMDAAELRRMFSPDKVERAMKMADNGSGRVDFGAVRVHCLLSDMRARSL